MLEHVINEAKMIPILEFSEEMVICLNYAFVNQIVRRTGKWKVTKDQFSGDKYPAGCNGAGIIFTRKGSIIHQYALLCLLC